MADLKITLLQTDIAWEDKIKNLQSLSHKLSGLKNKQDVILLPEMFNTGFSMNVNTLSETMEGPTLIWMKNTAKTTNSAIAGSLLIHENKHFYNRFVWMNPNATYAYYDKRHLFSMAGEDRVMSPGKKKKIIQYKDWKINLQVCYDLRFPVWSKNNFNNGEHDYDVMIFIANWPEVRNQAYKKLLPARAIENQAYVVWVNRVGVDGNGVNHLGDSVVYGPDGNFIDQAKSGEEAILLVGLSKKELDEVRNKFHVGRDWDTFEVNL
ncbi:MAG: amidohydrolase [Bacteroidales bacterium]|nr:amidohydrolase [Bacteroidales bacterium]MCF8405387.1 amidohydrolase [Bacteroidales bacterium]